MSSEKKTEIATIETEFLDKDHKYDKEIKRKFDFFILFTTTIVFIIIYFSFFPIIIGVFTPLEHIVVCTTLFIIFLMIWIIYFYKDRNYKLIFIIPWFISMLIFYWIFMRLVKWQLHNYIYYGISPNKIIIFSSTLILGIISSTVYQFFKIISYKRYFQSK